MPLVLGLGNPGARYAHTRHNAGWDVVERLVARWKASPLETAREYRAWHVEVEGKGIDLLVPLTFMNVSGDALDEWRSRHPFDANELLVVVDDVYLPLGRIRLRPSGSSGGHNGLASLEAAIGHREWPRLRVGVGAAPSAEALKDHVLLGFEPGERAAADAALDRAGEAVQCWCLEGLTKAMNRFNRFEEEVPES